MKFLNILNPKLYEDKDLNKTKKWSKKVDEMKNKWCSKNGVPLIRIWEKDINEHPENVLTFLKEKLHLLNEKKDKNDKFNKRH